MALSGPLLGRLRVIKVALEDVAKGTKAASITQALHVFDLLIQPTADYEDRKGPGIVRGHSVAGVLSEQIGKCTFSAEMRGDGAGGMEPGLAILLQACGLEKTLEVYQVQSVHTDDETISIEVFENGKKKCLIGASGNVTFKGTSGKRMMCDFEFSGIWQAPIDEALPVNAPSTTTAMRVQGGSFTLALELIKISEFSLNMGNIVIARKDAAAAAGIAYFMIPDYDPEVTLDPEADLVAGYDFNGLWLAGTAQAISLVVTNGTDKATFTLPAVVCKAIPEAEKDGILIHNYTGQCTASTNALDDAVKIEVAADV